VEVDVLVTVDVPDAGTFAALEIHGPRIVLLKRRRNSAGHHLDAALEPLLGPGRALGELGLLALGQLGDPRALDGRLSVGCGFDGRHLSGGSVYTHGGFSPGGVLAAVLTRVR
jgi:hypothetical protein